MFILTQRGENMKIMADKEGLDVISALCDIALKAGGIGNLQQINTIIQSIIPLPEEAPKTEIEE